MEQYKLTLAQGSKKMADQEGQEIEVDCFCLYRDMSKDEDGKETEKEILSIRTRDGDILGTISETFKRDFFDLVNFFEDAGEPLPTIKVISGKSKKDRKFVTCTVA